MNRSRARGMYKVYVYGKNVTEVYVALNPDSTWSRGQRLHGDAEQA